jgi:hypothetical protein
MPLNTEMVAPAAALVGLNRSNLYARQLPPEVDGEETLGLHGSHRLIPALAIGVTHHGGVGAERVQNAWRGPAAERGNPEFCPGSSSARTKGRVRWGIRTTAFCPELRA